MNIPSDVSHQDIARAFELCLTHLSNGQEGDFRTDYICYALDRATNLGSATKAGALWARAVVRSRIMPEVSAGKWLRNNVADAHDATDYQVQQWRRAWVKSMIEEFSN